MRRWMQASLLFLLAAIGNLGCAAATPPDIDPRADASLKRMSQTLAAAKSFKVHSTATMEDRTESGQMAQFSRDSVITVCRPDRFRADVRRGPDMRHIWHQGKELTILDVRRNVYTVIQTPERIDQMLDFLAEQHDIVIPLDDLFYPDPYKDMIERVETGVLVDQTEVDGHLCDHLLFTQDNVDWQIWIDTGKQAVPRKVVITYKDDPDRPQFEAVLEEWQLDVPPEASQFTPQIPPSAQKVEAEELEESE